MRSRHLDRAKARAERRIYGRTDRPAVEVPLADEWVVGELLMKTLEADGTWWARVAYIHPDTYEYVEELLPVDVMRTGSAIGGGRLDGR